MSICEHRPLLLDGHEIAAIKTSASISTDGTSHYNSAYRDATVRLVFLATLRHCLVSTLLEILGALNRRKEITGTTTLSSVLPDFFFNILSLPGVIHAIPPTFGALFLVLQEGWLHSILFSLVVLGL